MDVVAMYKMTTAAVEYCRAGQGAMFLEVKTYRYRGHSMSDPQKYRTKEEVAKYQEHDPIGRLEQILKTRGLADDAKLAAMNDEIHKQVEAAHAEAELGMASESRVDLVDVYADPYGPYQKREE
jgi:pyruvate dehydrogenase E1 component alpha subunit